MRLPLDLSNGGWHMPKFLNFRHVNRYSEDRTSLGTTGVTCLHKCPDLFMRLTATEEEARGLTRDLLDLVSTSMLHEALQCMDHQLWFNQLRYARFLASSSRPNITSSVVSA